MTVDDDIGLTVCVC